MLLQDDLKTNKLTLNCKLNYKSTNLDLSTNIWTINNICLEDIAQIVGNLPFTLDRYDRLKGDSKSKAVVVVDKEVFYFVINTLVYVYVQKYSKRNIDFNAALKKETYI